MKVSVIMCTYNGSRFLEGQLQSINMQTRVPDELIVCDDCSSDETVETLNNYAVNVKFPVTIRHNAKRLGASKNFERGITLAQGDIIVLSDQDDLWRHDKLQILEQALCQDPDAGYVFSDAILIDQDGEFVHPSLWQRVFFDSKRRALFDRSPVDQLQVLLGRNVVTGATMAFRARLKTVIMPIPELWVHDEWIAFASSLYGAYGVPISEPLTYYRQHAAQAIGLQRRAPLSLLKMAWSAFTDDQRVAKTHAREFQKWDDLYNRYQVANSLDPNLLALLKAKRAHVALRTSFLHRTRLARLPSIVGELQRRQYHIYSNGWNSALKDLVTIHISDRVMRQDAELG
jgi:glycosyltransferase involved in cell wall biosynthesis